MKKILTGLVLAMAFISGSAYVALANHDVGAPYFGEVLGKTKDGGTIQKISICHATASESNPYTNPEVNISSFFSGGHDTDEEDIIPPFHYTQGDGIQEFDGMNWDGANIALWESGCGAHKEALDVCPNIEGDQAEIPDGQHLDDQGNCVNDEIPPLGCDIDGIGGSLTDNGLNDGTANAEFHNGGNEAITVTFGSYKVYFPYNPNDPNFVPFGPWLTTQTEFDHQTLTIEPCSSINFQINVPECTYQLDLYKGEVLNWNVPYPEDFHLYFGDVFGGNENLCSLPPPTCEENEDCPPGDGGGNNTEITDPAIQKTVDGVPVPGSTVTYTLVVTENSDFNSSNIVVIDPMPAGVTYVSDDAAVDGDTVFAGGTLTWTIPSLLAHAHVILHITATIDGDASGAINNVATITGFPTSGNSDTTNDSDDANLTVNNNNNTITDDDDDNNGGGGGNGGGSSHHSSGSVKGASTDQPKGEVLGEEVGLPRTDSSDTEFNIIMLTISGAITLLGLIYLTRKSQIA
jgi:uncharacterized repeat protein (TIGR01451 family)